MALGKKLASEQEFDGSVDTLGRWMTHHIAELIYDAESASEEDCPTKLKNAREAILALWTHRHALPSGRSPFAGMEPIFNALESLDLDAPRFRYFSASRAPKDSAADSNEVQKNVEMAKLVDRASKVIVNFYLAEAALNALNTSEEWVKLASDAGAEDGLDIAAIRIIAHLSDSMKAPNPDSARRRTLNDRKQQLELLVAGASAVIASIDAQLDQLPPEDPEGREDEDWFDV